VGIHDSESSQVLLNRADQAQTARALGLERVDVLSQYNARMALPRLDYALNSVSESRASLGALQNRLQSVAENIKVSEQNASNSHSRIKDADFAYESAELVRSRLMREAGTGILAQANSSSAIALRLLG
jgi:flagellin